MQRTTTRNSTVQMITHVAAQKYWMEGVSMAIAKGGRLTREEADGLFYVYALDSHLDFNRTLLNAGYLPLTERVIKTQRDPQVAALVEAALLQSQHGTKNIRPPKRVM